MSDGAGAPGFQGIRFTEPEDLRTALTALGVPSRTLVIFRIFEYIRNMIKAAAILAFSALAHEHRLRVFRMLIRKGPGGMSAGDIAHRLAVPPSSLSFHLGQLERAGLIKSRRDQRRIIYAADIDGTRRVLAFLTEDCCDGHPEICGGLIAGYETRKRTPAKELKRR